MAVTRRTRTERFTKNGSYTRGATRSVCIWDQTLRLGRSRLGLRVLIAPNLKALAQLRKVVLGQDTNGRTHGLVNSLTYRSVKFRKNGDEIDTVVRDEALYAVMILSATKCGVETVVHECGHAAIYYATRARSHTWNGRIAKHDADRDDERICYPLGKIARGVFRILYNAGVWKDKDAAQYRQRG